jgi:hypothetical protein
MDSLTALLRKICMITTHGTKHIAKNMGSPIVRRRSRPQTAHTRVVSMTARERSIKRGLEILPSVLTFSDDNSEGVKPSDYRKLDTTLSLIDFESVDCCTKNNLRSHKRTKPSRDPHKRGIRRCQRMADILWRRKALWLSTTWLTRYGKIPGLL